MSFSSNLVKSIPSLKMLFSRLCSKPSKLGKKVSFIMEVDDGSKFRMIGSEGEILQVVICRYRNIVGDEFGRCDGKFACFSCHVKFPKEFYDKMELIGPEKESLERLRLAEDYSSRLSCTVFLTSDMEDLIIKIPYELEDY